MQNYSFLFSYENSKHIFFHQEKLVKWTLYLENVYFSIIMIKNVFFLDAWPKLNMYLNKSWKIQAVEQHMFMYLVRNIYALFPYMDYLFPIMSMDQLFSKNIYKAYCLIVIVKTQRHLAKPLLLITDFTGTLYLPWETPMNEKLQSNTNAFFQTTLHFKFIVGCAYLCH